MMNLEDSLLTIQTESNRVLVYPDSLTREELVLSNYKLQKEVNILKAAHSNITSAKEVAYEIRLRFVNLSKITPTIRIGPQTLRNLIRNTLIPHFLLIHFCSIY